MRIIAGTLRRRALSVPQGLLTRPSTDRVRESIFNLVTHRVALQDAEVLDLFAGTGSLGLEAISRGARRAVFVEAQGRVLAACRQNAMRLGVAQQCLFLCQDVLTYLERQRHTKFSVIFADPPYSLARMAQLPALALPILEPGGLFVLEHDKRIAFTEHAHLDLSRPYGRTSVSMFSSTTS